jgi:hypothetical protein
MGGLSDLGDLWGLRDLGDWAALGALGLRHWVGIGEHGFLGSVKLGSARLGSVSDGRFWGILDWWDCLRLQLMLVAFAAVGVAPLGESVAAAGAAAPERSDENRRTHPVKDVPDEFHRIYASKPLNGLNI